MLRDIYKEIANSSPNLLWLSDANGKYIFFNKAWLNYRGSSLEDEINCNRKEGVFPGDFKRIQNIISSGYENQKPYKVEYRLKNHQGEFRWMLENANPWFDAQNHFVGFMGTCTDIHNLKEFDRKKGEFIIAASHELKTPLTSLQMYLHLMQEYFNKNEIGDYKVYADNAELQLNRIITLINRMLDISRIQGGDLRFIWVNFSFHDLVSGIVNSARQLYPGRSFEFNSSSVSNIRGDLTQLTHAIDNLINNAVKYSDNSKKILIDLSEDQTFAYLYITDFGIGIDNKFKSKVFNRFFRPPGQAEQTYPGLGLGLYLTKKIIEKHRGKISVESEKGKKTVFSVKIPIKDKQDVTHV